jgi:hypothetical protein
MATEEWAVHTRLIGEFLISNERRSSEAPLVEGLRQLTLSPEFDGNGKWTGLHDLEAVLWLENDGDDPLKSNVVYEQAQRLVTQVSFHYTRDRKRQHRPSGDSSSPTSRDVDRLASAARDSLVGARTGSQRCS